MLVNKGKRGFNNLFCTIIIIEDIKAMLTGRMIHERQRNVAFNCQSYEFVENLVEKSFIFCCSSDEEWWNVPGSPG